MKYFNLAKRTRWETQHRATNPNSTQYYRLAASIAQEQQITEFRIEQYLNAGRRLKKHMRSYLRGKNADK
jgi:hypothetical protein